VQKITQKIKSVNKVFAIALLASVLAVPLAVHTYAQDGVEEPDPQVQNEEEQQEETPPEEDETPVVVPEEPTEEDEEPLPEDEEVPAPQETTITEAIAIAQAEHPDVEVVMAKVKAKLLDGQKVYKVVFADGWRVYVSADTGEILRIKDASNKKHDCSRRGAAAVAAWQSRFYKKWQYKPVRHHHLKKHSHRHDNWRHGWHKQKPGQQSEPSSGQPEQQNEAGLPAETEDPAEQ
jgi:uncharacterized membrane protein YkoI